MMNGPSQEAGVAPELGARSLHQRSRAAAVTSSGAAPLTAVGRRVSSCRVLCTRGPPHQEHYAANLRAVGAEPSLKEYRASKTAWGELQACYRAAPDPMMGHGSR